MFCPSAVDYGNVADWFAAVGSITVGSAAFYVAWKERQRALAAEDRLALFEAERHNDLIVPALRIIQQVQSATIVFQDVIERGDDSLARRQSWLRVLRQSQESALRLQQYPYVGAELFAEYEGLARAVDISDDMQQWPAESLVRHAEHVMDDTDRQKGVLVEMADKRAVLKW